MAEETFRSREDQHLSRRIYHAGVGTGVAFLFCVLSRDFAKVLTVSVSLVIVASEVLRFAVPSFNQWAIRLFGKLIREEEKTRPSGQLFFALGMCWCIVFVPRSIALQCILAVSWMDPLAAFIGSRYGRIRWKKVFARWMKLSPEEQLIDPLAGKTLEGSLAGFGVGFVAGLVGWAGPWAKVTLASGEIWSPSLGQVILFSAVGAAVATVAETWPSQWDDNVNIPFWTGLVLWALAVFLAIPLNFA